MNLKRIRCLPCLVNPKHTCEDCERPCCRKHADTFFEIGDNSRVVCYRCYRSLTRKANEHMEVLAEVISKFNKGEKLFEGNK